MTRFTSLALSAVVAAGCGLSACSMGTEAAPADVATSPAAEQSVAISQSATPVEAVTSMAPEPSPQVSETVTGLTLREILEFDVPENLAPVTCSDGVATVSQPMARVQLTGHCDVLDVSGNGAVVYAESVGRLAVTGSVATVYVTSVEEVDLADAGITVLSQSGMSQVSMSNDSNTLLAGGDIAKADLSGDGNVIRAVGVILDIQDSGDLNRVLVNQ